MTLMVTLADRWLVDVGFGDSFLEPLRLDEESTPGDGNDTYRIEREAEFLVLMKQTNEEEWNGQYRFTLKPYQYSDYAEMCRYHQTSPESHFTRARICSRATFGWRITLSYLRFITTSKSGRRQERILSNDEEYATILRNHFGIVMPLESFL
jgi:N-hydroxyarylamine O-acetyltransferase